MTQTPHLCRQVTFPLLHRESIGVSYHILTFAQPDGADAEPGQFAMIRGQNWGDACLLPRPMSYLTSGDKPSILIKVIGEGTRRMSQAQPGEVFSILGPLGTTWPLPKPGITPVLVGGGVGIAPLIFLARQLKTQGITCRVLYGGRTKEDLPMIGELAALGETQVSTDDGSLGHHGRVTELLEPLFSDGIQVYTCGPDRMMATVARLCESQKISCMASLEAPMACGYGVCLGCPVRTKAGGYIYTCVQGPCVDAKTIAWDDASGVS